MGKIEERMEEGGEKKGGSTESYECRHKATAKYIHIYLLLVLCVAFFFIYIQTVMQLQFSSYILNTRLAHIPVLTSCP